MQPLELLAAALGVVSSASYLLQAMKIEKVHASREVSLPMFSILFINAIVWLAYGISSNNAVVYIPYTVTTLATTLVIFEYFRYSSRIAKEGKKQARRAG